MTIKQTIEAAHLVCQGNSSDEVRAAMSLLRVGSEFAQAEMIRTFERAQHDIIKELVRLTNKELVTFHAQAALQRVNRILADMTEKATDIATDFAQCAMISGKASARIKSGDKNVDGAFDLSYGDNKRVDMIVNQMMGNISHAAACAEQSIHAMVQKAEMDALSGANLGVSGDERINYPSIEKGAEIAQEAQEKKTRGLSKKCAREIQKNPVVAAREIQAQLRKKIQFMRTQYVIGRREADMIRKRTLQSIAISEATGHNDAAGKLVQALLKDGITSFVDRGGHRWTLGNYCNMTVRTTSRQCSNVGELYDDPEHDLYIIVAHKSSCPVCARYEGRVYSRSGTSPYYPALSQAFGMIDKGGVNSIENTYLTIHPNCRHVLAKFIERARTPIEIAQIRRYSNPQTNPFENDPRTEEQINSYNEQQRLRGLHNEALREYREMLQVIPANRLGNFLTFKKHYFAKDEKYKSLLNQYKSSISALK